MSELRLGIGVLGWFLTYWWFFAFAGPAMTTCTQGSDDAWVISLAIYTPSLLVGVALIAQAREWSRYLRWGALPHGLTLFAAGDTLRTHFVPAVFEGRHLCDVKVFPDSYGVDPSWWHPLYWPLEVALLVGFVAFVAWFWRGRAAHAG